ncbi:MAG: 2'-5' RNA ligase family protein [Candidatus Krumholzibacteriia bacterium]
MAAKTHRTAVVVIPPRTCWEPIQSIRRQYDRQVRRWMPHVTLVYPFRPRQQFATIARPLRAACARIEPFEVRLARFRHFEHGRHGFTLWLEPEPPERLIQLQELIVSTVPDCDDSLRHPLGFTPHLSVGQVHGRDALRRLESELRARWRALTFTLTGVGLIWRGSPPDDVFRVDRTISLGG